MNWEEAYLFLESTKKYGSRPGLDCIRSLMGKLGDVQDRVPLIHIAGTNGKGSVGAMIAATLTEAGYRVGRFATPDVFSYEEEFLLNGEPIARERLAALFEEVAVACALLTAEGKPHPTRFEVETAAAYLWFYEEQVDIAVVEAGMGGALDATNVIAHPLLSVLTSIGMDHMKFLGNSLTEIAQAKAGIIKKRCPVVTVKQPREVRAVILETCAARGAPLVTADAALAGDCICTAEETSFLWYGDIRIWLGLTGRFQIENAVCALTVLAHLNPISHGRYAGITPYIARDALAKVRWPGRFEKIGSEPDFYLDGAHNEDAVRKLKRTLEDCFAGRRIVYIMGVLADKNFEQMSRILFRPGDCVFTLQPDNARALSAGKLADLLRGQGVNAVACSDAYEAVSRALDAAGKADVVLAFGSLYSLKSVRDSYAICQTC